jgi:hypothetical protein
MNKYSQVHQELNMVTKKYKQLRPTPNQPDE